LFLFLKRLGLTQKQNKTNATATATICFTKIDLGEYSLSLNWNELKQARLLVSEEACTYTQKKTKNNYKYLFHQG